MKEENTRDDYRKLEREYKGNVFNSIFNQPKEILELYNALNGSHYTDEGLIDVTTIGEGDLYVGIHNDSSFIINSEELNIWEHQSTRNPNMPMRELLYLAESYERYIKDYHLEKEMYTSRQVMFPTPKFVVFYNGMETTEDSYVMRLSDCFMTKGSDLKMQVKAYNINYGRNRELMEKCKTLQDYSVLIHRIRVYNKIEPTKEKAVERAIDECIKEHRLEEYLTKNRKEVRGMLLAIPTPEEIAEAQHKVDIEDAEARGEARGRAELLSELEEYMQRNHCSLEKAYQEIKAQYEKTAGGHATHRKPTGKTR